MTLHSRVCDILGIKYPILLAGMGGASVPRLAAAVSNAGGLGVLGAAACSPDQLREWIRETRSLTDKPFGVDTLLPASVRREAYKGKAGPSPMDLLPEYQKFAQDFMKTENIPPLKSRARESEEAHRSSKSNAPLFSKEFFEAQMEVVVEERVPVYAAGLGNPGPWLDRLHSGIDLIVAQGHDGGGHNSPIGTMALIPQVVDAIAGRIPVLGAGGISDGRGIAAAMMLGAEGAWIGTAFLATDEAGIEDFQKDAIVESGDGDTLVSRTVTGKPARIIRNKWSEAFAEAGLEPLPMPFQPMVAMPVLAAAAAVKRKDIAPGFAGQGMGLIHKVRPAAEVMADLVKSAEISLGRANIYL
jgi:NAD(P)H-dependent flavin oxidoreductase YrpB (nitropropane dioxygenase family)